MTTSNLCEAVIKCQNDPRTQLQAEISTQRDSRFAAAAQNYTPQTRAAFDRAVDAQAEARNCYGEPTPADFLS
jgi:hypothetical protein